MALSRRNFLNQLGVAGSLAAATSVPIPPASARGGSRAPISGGVLHAPFSPHAAALTTPAAGRLNLNVTTIETIWVDLPLRPAPARRMLAENYEWRYFQIHKVKLA
jgi:hypothetical protein